MARRALAYLRVSSAGQVKGDGFDRQRETIQRYARAHGIQIEKYFEDRGVSGTRELDDREGLAALLAEAEARQIPLALFERSDRLARENLAAELILQKFRDQSVQVIDCEADLELTHDSAPSKVLIRQLLQAVSEFEKSSLVAKLRRARERKRAMAGRCEGAKPFGFYPRERAAHVRVLELATQRLTLEQIAQKLDEEGFRPRSKKRWSRASVWKIVQRARQKGELDGKET